MSSPLLWRRSLVGAPAPGANSLARQLARWASSPAALRTSWCSSLPGGTGLSSPLPGVIVFVGAPAPGANSVAGSMGEFSCCTADELVLVPPGIAPAVVGVARVRYTPVTV